MRKTIGLALGAMLLASPALRAEYVSEEMCTIPWGNSAEQLKISPEVTESVYISWDSSWNYDTSPSIGPSQRFVDSNENIYLVSHGFKQLKTFDKTGRLLLDYSKGEPKYKDEFYYDGPLDIYVDSLSRIFILAGPAQDYIAIVDSEGFLLDKISPYPITGKITPTTCSGMSKLYFNFDDVLTLRYWGGTCFTYANGRFYQGGCSAWRAKDGYYYDAFETDSVTLNIERLESPDSGCNAKLVSRKIYSIVEGSIWYTEFLGVDDQMRLYLYIDQYAPDQKRVLVLNSDFSTVDQFVLPFMENKYYCSMVPFMRPSDGNIYEFRVLDDGLHVVRWSKK